MGNPTRIQLYFNWTNVMIGFGFGYKEIGIVIPFFLIVTNTSASDGFFSFRKD
jgi:hypothetical protein